MAGLAAELLAELSFRDAKRTARYRSGQLLPVSFRITARALPESRKAGVRICVVEILDEGIGDALLAGRSSGAAVAAILRHEELLAGAGDGLEQNVVECVSRSP